MTFKTALLVLVALCVGVGVGFTQVTAVRPVVPSVTSGPDVGFRIEGYKGSKPVGRLVVKVDGQWVEAEFAPGLVRLTQ